MARGRSTSLTIRLTPAERLTLLAWQRATTISAGRARRGRIILLIADGRSISDVAVTVGISRRFVYKWVRTRSASENLILVITVARGVPCRHGNTACITA